MQDAPAPRVPPERLLHATRQGIFGVFLGYRVVRWQDGEDSDSEAEGVEPLRPLRNFPAVALITAIHSALEARARLWLPAGAPAAPCMHTAAPPRALAL